MHLHGIGAKSRNLLAKVLSHSEGAISSSDVSEILQIPKKVSSSLLSNWARRGWLRRVRRGWFIPIPIESETSDIPIEDPWLIASQTFTPCYIGGWSAAQHWDFTEQIFHTVVVVTTRHLDSRHQEIGEVKYLVKEVPKTKFFGTTTLWRGSLKIQVSDPTKTIIDIMDSPFLAGGIRPAADMFLEYLNSEEFDTHKLISYAEKNGNKTVFKRMGFLIERIKPELYDLITKCKERISKGYSQLDPSTKEKKINTRWRLRVAKNDSKERNFF